MATYLDYNATAPIRPEAADAVARALQIGGNPSSVHAAGRAARGAMEQARAQVASLVGMPSGSVLFMSGAAEANALAVMSAVKAGARRLIIGATEHETVLATAEASGVASLAAEAHVSAPLEANLTGAEIARIRSGLCYKPRLRRRTLAQARRQTAWMYET